MSTLSLANWIFFDVILKKIFGNNIFTKCNTSTEIFLSIMWKTIWDYGWIQVDFFFLKKIGKCFIPKNGYFDVDQYN